MLLLIRNWIDAALLYVEYLSSYITALLGGVSWHRMSELARKTYYDATHLARRYRHSEIQPEHLLLATIMLRQGVAYHLLEELGVNIEDAQMRINQYLSQLPANPTRNIPSLSAQARAATRIALDQAAKHPERWVGTHHILYGILCQSDSVASQMLQEMGLTPEKIYMLLEE